MTTGGLWVLSGENTKCTNFVATDAYGMGIDNPDVALVNQWGLLLSFDIMIQRMGRAGRKDGVSMFVWLSLKWNMIKDLQELSSG